MRVIQAQTEGGSALSEADRSNLGWMLTLNDEYCIGFLWPTVRKHRHLPEFATLIDRGLAECRHRGAGDRGGYWITEAGREAVRAALSAPSFTNGERP